WGAGDLNLIHKQAAEMVALDPDVILASTSQVMFVVQQFTRSVPIVFTAVTDPVAGGFVASLGRPGGNAPRLTSAAYSRSAKRLELLKDIAPKVTRAAVLYDTRNPGGLPQFAAVQAMATALGIELTPISLLDAPEIERTVSAFAQVPNGGLIVTRLAEAIIH